jgi:hypothetical protein
MSARSTALLFCSSLAMAAFPSAAKATVELLLEEYDPDAFTVQVFIESSDPVGGFQFDVTGFTIAGVSGGLSEELGFSISFSENRLIGFSLAGSNIPATDDVLLLIHIGKITAAEGCLENIVLASPDAQAMDVIGDECVSLEEEEESTPYLRGNANDDSQVSLSDAVFILAHLFLGEAAPPCRAAADVTGDRVLDLSDAVFVLNYLFLGGDAPTAPFPDCGAPETTDADLPCEVADSCNV